jgi:hypothetical protein
LFSLHSFIAFFHACHDADYFAMPHDIDADMVYRCLFSPLMMPDDDYDDAIAIIFDITY